MAEARTTDPQTSHDAAASLDEPTIRRSQDDVLAVLRGLVVATDSTLVERYFHLAYQGKVVMQSESGIRTRRKELVVKGYVEDTGQTTILPSGRKSIIWRVK